MLYSCQNNSDFTLNSNISKAHIPTTPTKLTIWNKPYKQEEIIKLKHYVKSINNRLVLVKDVQFALDSLKICKEAYDDLIANLIDVNKVIEQAEQDSLEINLQYPLPTTYSTNHVFAKSSAINDINIIPVRLKSFRETDDESGYVLLSSMAANSRCSFVSSTVRVKSQTYVNSSVFIWTFMIYDEVWGHQNGANGVGVIGENNGNYEYIWLYSLDNHTGEFNWKFRNVSSNTDGVSISHRFYGGKVKL